MVEATEKQERKEVTKFTVHCRGTPTVTAHQSYCTDGFIIEKGQTLDVTIRTLPEEYQGTVDTLYKLLKKHPAMEVKSNEST